VRKLAFSVQFNEHAREAAVWRRARNKAGRLSTRSRPAPQADHSPPALVRPETSKPKTYPVPH